jgi:nicotinamide-nucleotide amidase
LSVKRPLEIGGASLSFRLGWLLLFVPTVTWAAPPEEAASAESARDPVRYMIVVTGGELLSGVYPDGHTQFLTQTLHPLGLECVGSMSVDDKSRDIIEALSFAGRRAALIIVTGGLGPTDNDVTRQTLSEFTGTELKEDPDLLAAMSRRFRAGPDGLRENLRRQIRVPVGGTYLKNAGGTAAGLVFQSETRVIVALPGPPRELQPMVRDELLPYLSRRFGTRMPGCSLTLRLVGLGQSQISQTLEDHVPLPADAVVSSQFDGSRVDFTFSLPHDTPGDRARLDELKGKILEHLSDNVYSVDNTSLEGRVVSLLAARGATLALVEAGSGGSLAAALDGVEGARQVVAGAFVAPTEEKLRRLLRVSDDQWTGSSSPADRTELLATAAARATGSPWAVAVGEPRQDENGTGYVEVVVEQPDHPLESRRVGLHGGGESARARLVTQLLDQLWRKVR